MIIVFYSVLGHTHTLYSKSFILVKVEPVTVIACFESKDDFLSVLLEANKT